MYWLLELFTQHGIAQAVIIYSLVISVGIILGRISLFGISLGITWILFVGIAFSYVGLTVQDEISHFLRDFGLILFVYAIGLQVGPGFFASLNRNAITFNLLAGAIVLLGFFATVGLHYLTGSHIGVMAGIMSGAVTNTPGLGAARTALSDMHGGGTDMALMTLAYAVAYPFGVVGIIVAMLLLKGFFKIDLAREGRLHRRLGALGANAIVPLTLKLENEALLGKPLKTLHEMLDQPVIVSRMLHRQRTIVPSAGTRFARGDILLIVATRRQVDRLKALVGSESDVNLKALSGDEVVDRLVIVTQPEVTHRPLRELINVHNYDVNFVRVLRAGVEIIPQGNSFLQLGDTVKLVGLRGAVDRVAEILGNSPRKLEAPDLAPIFLGIVLGVILGSVPFTIPGMPAAVKIGLAAGPLVIAMPLSRFGGRLYLTNYTTHSANLMLRELGITLFLASIGLGSGTNLAEAFAGGRGFVWMAMGAVITLVPLIVVGYVAIRYYRRTYFQVCGLLAGAATDPPALAFAVKMTGSDVPSSTYATVYPFVMIMRIVAAQLLVFFFI